MSDQIERARLLATFVHLGQKRQDGEDYINHPQRMVNEYIKTVRTDDELLEADYELLGEECLVLTEEQEDIICDIWMHDTIEDAPIKWEMNDFILNIFGYDIWNIVIRLTHDKSLESYNEYIERVSLNTQALQIKFLDMTDNTSYPIPEKQWLKYRRACILLRETGIEIPPILKERLKV